jgi:hypothetical protein
VGRAVGHVQEGREGLSAGWQSGMTKVEARVGLAGARMVAQAG